MWKFLTTITRAPVKYTELLNAQEILQQQLRTTYVLKRRTAPLLHKKGNPPKKMRSRHYVYDLVKQTHIEKQPNIDVILTSYVDTLGNIGDKVSVKPHYAYVNLLLPRLAVYASPENIEKYKGHIESEKDELRYSSANALLTVKMLSHMLLSVVMNKDVPWILKPWHIKVSFRKTGFIVPEDAITLPENPIKGPDMNIEDKEFFVVVMVNNQEKVNVRCRIHHWSTDVYERAPYKPYFFYEPAEPLFPEQAPILDSMPKKPVKNVK